MENLNREAILRMLSGKTGNSSSGGGGGDIDLAGYATMIWVTENFVSIDFFRELFRAFDSNSQEILPNDTTSVVASIKAMVGTWTEEYLTALGNAGGGGGGGGGAQYLNDLLDVQLTTPLTDGQALVYNATLAKWVNGAAGVNMTTVWNALAGSTNEQINASHLSTALSGYVTTSAISDMATQTWVGQQGFATQTWVTSNFITIAYFDRLFRAYNNSTPVSHNDTTTTIDNIKAMFGFWTDFYLSALGTGGVSSVSISLSQLADVNVAGVTNNQFLGYDSTNSEWVNTSLKTINGNSIIGTGDLTIAGVSTISALSDVLLTNLLENQVLYYDGHSHKWQNVSLKTINGYGIFGTGDIPVSGGTTGNYLPLAGGYMTGRTYFNYTGAWYAFGTSLQFFIGSNEGDNFYLWSSNSTARLSLGTNSLERLSILPNGNVGIGTASPYYKLDVINNSVNDWTIRAGGYLSDVKLGHYSGYGLGIRSYTRSTSVYLIEARNELDSDYDDSFVFVAYADNRVGISMKNPQHRLHVNGNICATYGVIALSDIRHKKIIKETSLKIDDIARMPAVMYKWNDGRKDNDMHVGSIAQDWQRVLPEVVNRAKDEKGTLSLDYGVAALVSSIIIARKVVNHEDRIKQLEKENKELKERLNIA